jgi:hypothetical protein
MGELPYPNCFNEDLRYRHVVFEAFLHKDAQGKTLRGKAMINVFLVFIDGGIGSVARYLMTNTISRAMPGATFPWHTLVVNIFRQCYRSGPDVLR